MLIDCISDLHGFYPDLKGGDLLLVAGDLVARGSVDEYDRFMTWLLEQPYRCKVVIAGNHDGLIEKGRVVIENENIHYLCDSGIVFEGMKIWGSPFTPTFLSWYFMRDRGASIKKHWDLIPEDTDILMTHGPPHGILDLTSDNIHAGCEELRLAVERVKPKIHCFGHIHECGGKISEIGPTSFVNCSYVDERYRPVHSCMHLVLKGESS